jgi:hypothetical protein
VTIDSEGLVTFDGGAEEDEQLVWAVISPRGAIHAAMLYAEELETVPGHGLTWLRFPCMGGPHRSPRDMAICDTDRKVALEAARFIGSGGMFCLKPFCERAHREVR